MDTRRKIIERVRVGRTSPSSAFNCALSAEENSTNNCEVPYKSQTTQELDKATQDRTDDISLPTTASNSHDSRDDSVLRDALVEEGDTHDLGNEDDPKAPNSVFTDFDSSVFTDVVTNINNPGVGFTDASVNDSINYTVEEYSPGKKKVSFDENIILEDEQSEATSPPRSDVCLAVVVLMLLLTN